VVSESLAEPADGPEGEASLETSALGLEASPERSDRRDAAAAGREMIKQVQGYLAHKKHPPSLGPPQGPRHSPTVGS